MSVIKDRKMYYQGWFISSSEARKEYENILKIYLHLTLINMILMVFTIY